MDKEVISSVLASPHGKAAYHVVDKLCDAGFDAWWVGGCVRDMILGIIPDDIDIGTDATPDAIMKIFPKHDDASAVFGSMRVKEAGFEFEVTTFREDDQVSNGRHPESVKFSTRERDADRRDITINALYFHPISCELYDPHGGVRDLSERLIRFIGDPDVRIEHDALRLLRVIRFRALIDGQYHPKTYQALHRNARMIDALSGIRLFNEFVKMLNGPNPDIALEDLWETDVLEGMIPELQVCKGVAQPNDYHKEGDVWDHIILTTRAFTREHGSDIRLAAVFHDCGKPKTFDLDERIRFNEHASVSADVAREALDRLHCPAIRREKICWLIAHHMMMKAFHDPGGSQEMSEERKSYWYYHPWFLELLQLFWLDIAGTEPPDFSLYEAILKDYYHFLDSHPRPPKPLLSGRDVMEILGIDPGERVGEALEKLYAAQIAKEVTTKEEAKKFLEEWS